MPLPRPSSPAAVWSDLRAFARERSKHQWIAATAAIVMPALFIFGFWLDGRTNLGPKEQVIYAQSWSAARTDDEIKAQQTIDKAANDKRQAERQRYYKDLQERLGTKSATPHGCAAPSLWSSRRAAAPPPIPMSAA